MQDAQTANQQPIAEARPTPLPLRSDTILGVCQALGDDFGFNPLWLRAALPVGLFWHPELVIGLYLGLGVIVAISRLAFPPRRVAIPAAAAAAPAAAAVEARVEQPAKEERELIAA